MTLEVKRMGRALSPIRPGDVIKQVLSGTLPIIVYEGDDYVEKTVNEACIVDLHNTYKVMVNRENQLRSRNKQLRVMTYNSFCHLFKFARYLNLVELVREEDMVFPPPNGSLYQLYKELDKRSSKPKIKTSISKRRIFKITQKGIDDERGWSNLCQAYKEGWKLPIKFSYVDVYKPKITDISGAAEIDEEDENIGRPRKAGRIRETKEEKESKPGVKLPVKPSYNGYRKAFDYIEEMQSTYKSGMMSEEYFKSQLGKLAITAGDWEVLKIESKIAAEESGDAIKARREKTEETLLHQLYIEGIAGSAVNMLSTLDELMTITKK